MVNICVSVHNGIFTGYTEELYFKEICDNDDDNIKLIISEFHKKLIDFTKKNNLLIQRNYAVKKLILTPVNTNNPLSDIINNHLVFWLHAGIKN